MDIFRYNDGEKERFGDPMRIERILESYCGGSFADLLKQVQSPNPDISMPAVDQMLAAVRTAFEVKGFDPATGQGATEEFQFDLLEGFTKWRDKKKATSGSGPKSATPSVGMPPNGRAPSQKTASPENFYTASGLTSGG